jgi:hypothetical protein
MYMVHTMQVTQLTHLAGSLMVFLEGSHFHIDGPPPGPLLYCTQKQYSSLMNPPIVAQIFARNNCLGMYGYKLSSTQQR